MLQVGSHWSRSTYQRVLVGSRAINTPHYLTTVPLARVAGGGHFYAVCRARSTVYHEPVTHLRQVDSARRTHRFL